MTSLRTIPPFSHVPVEFRLSWRGRLVRLPPTLGEGGGMNRLWGVLATLALTTLFQVQASDLAKEKRWADQIVDALMDGDAEWLTVQGQEFLTLYTQAAEGDGKRAAIVLHGIGVHPNWPQVVYPLRVRLVEHGWATASLQMPVLSNDAEASDYAPLFNEVAPRIDAAVAFLRQRGAEDIVIVGHSLGAAMAAYYLATGERPIKAFVGIGMNPAGWDGRLSYLEALRSIGIPILDLYGSNDQEGVLDTAGVRREAAASGGNRGYRQVKVEGADHFFDGREAALVEAVSGWLNEVVPAK
jgi:pimeloyl-ACP methyl ester carboxylesterase